MSLDSVKALTFDVFGTVVDWRSSITREIRELGERKGFEIDWAAFAGAWRGLYQPGMEAVRSGKREWTILDVLHRESLVTLLDQFGINDLSEAEIDDLNRAWHRLDPWPDTVPGMRRLHRKYPLATLSNGNVALLMNMARRAGLPWDAILGAEPTGAYKPMPAAYLGTARMLGLEPSQVMLVAAHNDDLLAARSVGFQTGFVARPNEYGPNQKVDFKAEHDFEVIAASMLELADALGC